jgi:hypothetical protein
MILHCYEDAKHVFPEFHLKHLAPKYCIYISQRNIYNSMQREGRQREDEKVLAWTS